MTTINAASIAQRAVRKTRGPRPKDVKRNIQRYKADPVAFLREVLHMEPAPYREDIARQLVTKRRVAVRARWRRQDHHRRRGSAGPSARRM